MSLGQLYHGADSVGVGAGVVGDAVGGVGANVVGDAVGGPMEPEPMELEPLRRELIPASSYSSSRSVQDASSAWVAWMTVAASIRSSAVRAILAMFAVWWSIH